MADYKQKDGIMAGAILTGCDKSAKQKAVNSTTEMVVETKPILTESGKKMLEKFHGNLKSNVAVGGMVDSVDKPMSGVKKRLRSTKGRKNWNA